MLTFPFDVHTYNGNALLHCLGLFIPQDTDYWHQRYLKCAQLSWKCIPLAVESYGTWDPEALKAFSQVATRLAIRVNTYNSKGLSHILIRANARAILLAVHCVSNVRRSAM